MTEAHNSSLVNLSIPANVTQPIIAAKIQEAITVAMGGADKIVAGVVHQICNTKVDPKNGRIDGYSSNNTITWMDYHVTELLQAAIKEELGRQIKEVAAPVREELIKQLQTKKGASAIAALLLSSLEGQLGDKYSCKLEIKFDVKKPDRY
jgi:hypothetical protein